MNRKKTYGFANARPPVVVVSAPAPSNNALTRFRAQSRSSSGALRRWKEKAANAARSSRATFSRFKENILGARGMAMAGLGGALVALAEEYVVEDVAGLPTAIPVAIGLHIIGGRAGRMGSDVECAAHGAAGVAGYQLMVDYGLDALRDLTS